MRASFFSNWSKGWLNFMFLTICCILQTTIDCSHIHQHKNQNYSALDRCLKLLLSTFFGWGHVITTLNCINKYGNMVLSLKADDLKLVGFSYENSLIYPVLLRSFLHVQAQRGVLWTEMSSTILAAPMNVFKLAFIFSFAFASN